MNEMTFYNKSLYSTRDNRLNIYELEDTLVNKEFAIKVKEQSESVACIIREEANLTEQDTYYEISKSAKNLSAMVKLKEVAPLGENEAFRDEPSIAYSTAFLVGKRLMLTAAHCVCEENSAELHAENAKKRIVFGFQMTAKNECRSLFQKKDVYQIKKVLAHEYIRLGVEENSKVDWALIKLDRSVEDREPLPVNFSAKVVSSVSIYMLGYSQGTPQKFSGGGLTTEHQYPHSFGSRIDAFDGNSGSPIFNSLTNEVVGIFFSGKRDYMKELKYRIGENQFEPRMRAINYRHNPLVYETCQRVETLGFWSMYIQASEGNRDAQWEVAHRYASGDEEVEKDCKESVKFYEKAAIGGHTLAQQILPHMQYELAKEYEEGSDKNLKRAFKYYRKAAFLGHREAQYKVGEYYQNGKGGIDKNSYQAVHWCERVIDEGVGDPKILVEAYQEIAEDYYCLGGRENLQKSVSNYEKAQLRRYQHHTDEEYRQRQYHIYRLATLQNALADSYYDEIEGVKNLQYAVYYYERVASTGIIAAGESLDEARRKLSLAVEEQEGYLVAEKFLEGDALENHRTVILLAKELYEEGLLYFKKYSSFVARTGKNIQKAVKYLEEATELGSTDAKKILPEALWWLGNAYFLGKHLPEDQLKAAECWEKAGDYKVSELVDAKRCQQKAYYNIGVKHKKSWEWSGQRVEWQQAIYYYEKAIALGDTQWDSSHLFHFLVLSLCDLADCYHKSQRGSPEDLTKAFYCYEKAAQLGDISSLYWMGEFYFEGKGISQNYYKALEYFEKAAERGNTKAKKFISRLFPWVDVKEVIRKKYQLSRLDYSEIPSYLQKENFEANDTYEIAYYLGACYENGNGVTKDLGQADRYYNFASEGGHTPATYRLGVFSRDGIVFPKEQEYAKLLFRQAASKGCPDAELALLELESQGCVLL